MGKCCGNLNLLVLTFRVRMYNDEVRFVFADAKLRMLYTTGRTRLADNVVHSFFRVMAHIDQAIDERDLYHLKSLHFEKLRGDRLGQHSLRLNKQFRLVVEVDEDTAGRLLRIVEIVDYH